MTDGPVRDDSSGRSQRPRRHRRASSPATTGHPDAGHWTKDAPRRDAGADRAGRADQSGQTDQSSQADESGQQPVRRVAGSDGNGGPESAQDRWWREQRPPHYE
ncbi:hypothetical protein [Flexivirga sp. B27]